MLYYRLILPLSISKGVLIGVVTVRSKHCSPKVYLASCLLWKTFFWWLLQPFHLEPAAGSYPSAFLCPGGPAGFTSPAAPPKVVLVTRLPAKSIVLKLISFFSLQLRRNTEVFTV